MHHFVRHRRLEISRGYDALYFRAVDKRLEGRMMLQSFDH
jgi:hypothetical protein